MQQEPARSNDERLDDEAANSNDAVNARLVEILKANTVRADGAGDDRMPKRGFFAEAYAVVSLIGLMAVAYVYSAVVGKDA